MVGISITFCDREREGPYQKCPLLKITPCSAQKYILKTRILCRETPPKTPQMREIRQYTEHDALQNYMASYGRHISDFFDRERKAIYQKWPSNIELITP